MTFSKIDADIPVCCRLPIAPGDLNAAERIPALPSGRNADKKQGAVREKWIFWETDEGETEMGVHWPEIGEFIRAFPGTPDKVHVGRMPAGTKLPIHRDGFFGDGTHRPLFEMFNRSLRFHIALQTNPDALMYSDGKFYHMGRGEAWMINNMASHSAINDHPTEDRYHLVFDIIPNDETFALLDGAETGLGEDRPDIMAKHWPGRAA